MVLILDGNSEIGEDVRSNVCYLICLRHLNKDRKQSQSRVPQKDQFSFKRPQNDLSYHLIYVPCGEQSGRRDINCHFGMQEWLPVVLGNQMMETFGMFPLSAGFSTDYDDSFDPRINNEFAAAAFRFGHSLVSGRHLIQPIHHVKISSGII